MVKITTYLGDVPVPLWSEICKSRLDAFQKKVFWLNCQSLGFIQEHKMSCPVLDMMSDQLKRETVSIMQFLFWLSAALQGTTVSWWCNSTQKGPSPCPLWPPCPWCADQSAFHHSWAAPYSSWEIITIMIPTKRGTQMKHFHLVLPGASRGAAA